ncbi:MAG TPA: NAD(P)/FAD-dependent oxidoreductase [Bryobacteraceae bacterium]|nr:NAD(P)/FAD-dependent oxidoreductase [Bryobacteraceae bacterium]
MRHRVVIIGGGFGGLYTAQALRDADADITLIDRRNFHCFQPLLYQVATGALSAGEITAPLRHVLNRQKNTRVWLGEVAEIDVPAQQLLLRDGARIPYDSLIVAAGATHHYFGHPEWAAVAPGLKTIEDATEIRTRVLLAFERAERLNDREEQLAELTFVVVGGGPTGVELAGALGEVARDALRADFRNINPADANIFLIEGVDRVLPAFPPSLSEAAEKSLIGLGVRSRTATQVIAVDADGVTVRHQGVETRIRAKTVLWAAGVDASPLGESIARGTGIQLDSAGRVPVGPDLSVEGHPEIFVIGDMSKVVQDGRPVPGTAPAAIQEGRYVAQVIINRLGGKTTAPFRYHDKGMLATIGRRRAVGEYGPFHFTGTIAWLAWLFIHLIFIIGTHNRVLVLLKWAHAYFTLNRGARMITGTSAELANGGVSRD